MGCGHCGQCQPKCRCEKKCPRPCGCPESILSIEADSTDPAYLRFNLGGRSVWYDFTPVVKAAETCTHISFDVPSRTMIYDAECGRQTISAREIGSILHLGDIGDVDASTVDDNAILVYRKDAECGENCDGATGWIGVNPVEEGDTSLEYLLGTDSDGRMKSLLPPASKSKYHYLTWAGADKAVWKQIRMATTAPVDDSGKKYALYLDPNTREIVFVMEDA